MKQLLFGIAILSMLGCGNQNHKEREAETSAIKDTTVSVTTVEQPTASSSVLIEFCYPSEEIPALNVFLRNTETGSTLTRAINKNTRFYTFEQIPIGTYHAFAYTAEALGSDDKGQPKKEGGAYTKAVPCGLSVACKDHSLIDVKVDGGRYADTVKICDWYTDDIPAETMQ